MSAYKEIKYADDGCAHDMDSRELLSGGAAAIAELDEHLSLYGVCLVQLSGGDAHLRRLVDLGEKLNFRVDVIGYMEKYEPSLCIVTGRIDPTKMALLIVEQVRGEEG